MTKFIPALHGLRGIAALIVVYSGGHAGGYLEIPWSDYTGGMGVSLFFCLSGFLMAYLYLPISITKKNLVRYLGARIARVYPLFAFVVVLSGVMSLFFLDWPFYLNVIDVARHLIGLGDASTIWTVSTELQFYLLFVVLWFAYAVIFKCSVTKFSFFLLCICFILFLIDYSTSRISIFGYLHVFVFGVLASLFLNRLESTKLIFLFRRYNLIFLLASWSVWMYSAYHASEWWGGRWIYQVEWLMIITALIVFFTALNVSSIYTQLLSTRIFVTLGNISFGLYLLHRPLLFLIDSGFSSFHELYWLSKTLIYTFSLIIVSYFSYVFIEVPARKKLRSKTV